jgi:hypothetical protein
MIKLIFTSSLDRGPDSARSEPSLAAKQRQAEISVA